MHNPDKPVPATAQVRAGMRVLDCSGEDVGTVRLVRMGDAEATTTAGQENTGEPIRPLADFLGAGEPDVHPQFVARLQRTGYLKIVTDGLFRGAVYAPADEISAVHEDVVHLSSSQESLVKQS